MFKKRHIQVIKKFTIFLLIPLFSIVLYLLFSFVFTLFPTEPLNEIQDKKIYILYNEMHTDIILKLTKNNKKWNRLFPLKYKEKGYLAFGWGDKETYLNTPTWNRLKISTILKALFINTPSLMHVSYYSDIKRFKNIKIITLSKQQLQELEKSILKSFNFENNQYYKAYANNDLFYPSTHQYNLFHTCNTWTGDRLREANITMSYWTPLSQNVISSLP